MLSSTQYICILRQSAGQRVWSSFFLHADRRTVCVTGPKTGLHIGHGFQMIRQETNAFFLGLRAVFGRFNNKKPVLISKSSSVMHIGASGRRVGYAHNKSALRLILGFLSAACVSMGNKNELIESYGEIRSGFLRATAFQYRKKINQQRRKRLIKRMSCATMGKGNNDHLRKKWTQIRTYTVLCAAI